MRRYPVDNFLDVGEKGLDLIKRFEGFRPSWYRCPAGVWTIGYGTTESVPGVSREKLPGPISKSEAERLLIRSLIATYEPAVEEHVMVELSQPQFSALVSFTYNVGAANFRRSTLLKKINREDFDGAAREFSRWVYAGGTVWSGLERRREAERILFLTEEEPAIIEKIDRLEPMMPQRVLPVHFPFHEIPTPILSLFGQL